MTTTTQTSLSLCLLRELSCVWEVFSLTLCLFVIWTKGTAFCTGSNIVCMRCVCVRESEWVRVRERQWECEGKSECDCPQVYATTLLNSSSHHVRSATSHFSRGGGKPVFQYFNRGSLVSFAPGLWLIYVSLSYFWHQNSWIVVKPSNTWGWDQVTTV